MGLGPQAPPFRVLKSRRELLCRAVRPCITNMLGPQALTKRAFRPVGEALKGAAGPALRICYPQKWAGRPHIKIPAGHRYRALRPYIKT